MAAARVVRMYDCTYCGEIHGRPHCPTYAADMRALRRTPVIHWDIRERSRDAAQH